MPDHAPTPAGDATAAAAPLTGPSVAPPRGRLPTTSSGTLTDAFGTPEWGLLAAIALIWGSSFVFMAEGLEALRPAVITTARLGLGALALSVLPRARRAVDREDLPRIAFLGVIWMAIPLLLFPIAQQSISSSVAGMINGAMPIATAAWSTALLRQLPGRRQLVGIAVGFAGIVAIFLPELGESAATARGALLVGLAVVLYGLAANVAVPLQQRHGTLPVLWRAQLVALAVVAPFGVAQLDGSRWELGPVLAMVPLGVLGTGLAFAMMATLVGRVGGTRGSVAIYFVPVVAIVLGVALRGERVAPLALLGTGLVLLGAWLTSRREG
ncbi:MAG: DMT family transporter [Actinomycetes bacterium]